MCVYVIHFLDQLLYEHICMYINRKLFPLLFPVQARSLHMCVFTPNIINREDTGELPIDRKAASIFFPFFFFLVAFRPRFFCATEKARELPIFFSLFFWLFCPLSVYRSLSLSLSLHFSLFLRKTLICINLLGCILLSISSIIFFSIENRP
jgi:hypothetical protein